MLFGELHLGHSSGLNTHYPSKQARMLAEVTIWNRLGTIVFTLNQWTVLVRRVSQSCFSGPFCANLNTNWFHHFRAIFFFLAGLFQQTVAVFSPINEWKPQCRNKILRKPLESTFWKSSQTWLKGFNILRRGFLTYWCRIQCKSGNTFSAFTHQQRGRISALSALFKCKWDVMFGWRRRWNIF